MIKLALIMLILIVTPSFAIENTSDEVSRTNVIEDKVLLPIKLQKIADNKVEAKLIDLQPNAIEIGLHNLVITGQYENNDGNVTIAWDGAYIFKEDGEKKSTFVSDAFNSDISVNPALSKGDEFSAEGKTGDLLAAWQRLMAEDEEEKEETEEEQQPPEEEEPPQPSQNFGGNAKEEAKPLDFTPPEYTATPDPVITSTTDGCAITIDVAQMAAIVQERVLQDGAEVSPCSETLTRYPLEKKYSSCPVSIDTENLKVYQQFTLSYTDPDSGGSIQVQDCTADSEQATAIIEDTDNCAIRHDFAVSKSFQQSRLIYTDSEGVTQEVQSCEDTETSYDHITTADTCSPVVDSDAGLVTFQYRKKIDLNGVDTYITECTPDASSSVAVEEEICTSPRYTHDFLASQSYLNKTWYYMDGASRVDIIVCGQSEDTFIHKQDEAVCTAVNDDVTKETTLKAKTYIEEEVGTPIYISVCEEVYPTIPYIKTGDKWRVISTNSSNITLGGSGYSNYTANSWNDGAKAFLGWPIENSSGYVLYRDNSPTYYHWQRSTGVTGQLYCLKNQAYQPWSVSGIAVDATNSDQSPTWSTTKTLNGNGFGQWPYSNSVNGSNISSFSCSTPTCILTQLHANPVYLRGDNSEFIDLNTTTEAKYVCGIGSKLDGQMK